MKLGTRELYQPIQSNKSVAVPRQDSMSPALGISNKSVAVPRQDSMSPCRAHAVLSGHCNRYVHVHTLKHYCALGLRLIHLLNSIFYIKSRRVHRPIAISYMHVYTCMCIQSKQGKGNGSTQGRSRKRLNCPEWDSNPRSLAYLASTLTH